MTKITYPLNRTIRFSGMALFALLSSFVLHAESIPTPTTPEPSIPRFAIGAEVGTAGFGPVMVLTATKQVSFDLGYTLLSYNYDFSDNKGDYKGKLKLSNLQAIANWHPFASSFHVSAGAFFSNNKVALSAKAKNGAFYGIGDNDYASSQITSVDGTVELIKGAAPYLGLGWSKTPSKTGFGFYCKLGVVFMNSPNTKLAAHYAPGAPASVISQAEADLRKDEKKANDDLNFVRYYPVVEIGLMYRF